MNRLLLMLALVLVVFTSCKKSTHQEINQDHLIYATLWFQSSPENQALYHQGFNIAKMQLAQFAAVKSEKPKAVVVDIDETMLDNSPFQAQEIIDNKEFSSEFWNEWSQLGNAKALPGAKEFSNFCDSIGVTLFYISNRKTTELDATIKNLDSLGFSFAKPEYFLLKENESSKKTRREKVSAEFDIVMLIGDNLNDFSEVFESRGDDWGASLVEQYKNEFGKRYIVLPNPMYGDWEKNLYKTKDLTLEQKYELRKQAVKGFK
ncbi:MAG: 5'-nucleotidase, lipoprotein e(P4) family [Bacteroidales bacterium]|nr:MAG: 5'-nucleotidase, lipoprotein e(P4) family [Bacteroidales bacterium]